MRPVHDAQREEIPMLTVKRDAARGHAIALKTAEDLVSPNPISVRDSAAIGDAAALIEAEGVTAAHVVDEAGRPVGVVCRNDLLSQQDRRASSLNDFFNRRMLRVRVLLSVDGPARRPTHRRTVRDVMTPSPFKIGRRTPANAVLDKMLELGVGRLVVVDDDGTLVGVVNATDVLKSLRPKPSGRSDHFDSARASL
jgi:CBS domain-containing protein